LLVFLPFVLLGYYGLSRYSPNSLWPMRWLFAASLIFYGWWSWIYLWVLLASIISNYLVGRAIAQQRSEPAARALMWVGITGNLGLLAYFKYANFFVANVNSLLSTDWHIGLIVLPLAISFHTFQQIAYLVEVRNRRDVELSLERYLLFVAFFPQLIAGPIVRHHEIAPQFAKLGKSADPGGDLAVGLSIFLIGLAKKTLLADPLAPLANAAFAAAQVGNPLSSAAAWLGALAYTLQLYFDFSGYSEMAVGLARMFGIRLPINFWSPYLAANIAEFWRRWHMTLSRFLRDYLYIPLGGNRHGVSRTYLNLLLTMALGGLWHGASWTFVAWGLYHGVLLCAYRLYRERIRQQLFPGRRVGRVIAIAFTFLAVVCGWVLFRAPDIATALRVFQAMASVGSVSLRTVDWTSWLHLSALLVLVFMAPNTWQLMAARHPVAAPVGTELSRSALQWKMSPAWAVAFALVGAWSVLATHRYTEFLYFQF
jgi:alginate O-acetyltransferase complex protein AlgI